MKVKKISANAKKVIVLCTMVALLVVTGALNFVLNSKLTTDKPDSVVNNPVDTFFSSYRTDRETARAEEFAYLDAILASSDSSEDMIASAGEKKMELLAAIEKELVIEGLIKAQGFNDAVVTMSTNNVNVVVPNAELTDDQISQILAVILSETDYSAKQGFVVPCSVD